jgi:hypothetical protein
MPVIIAERLGEHTPAVAYAFANIVPISARLSMLGVLANVSP